MKRLPLITLLGVLCFVVLSIFTQHRAAADRTQSNHQADQAQSNKTIVNNDRAITTVSDDPAEGEFVPGEIIVKFHQSGQRRRDSA